jgi:CRP-like cAMP-binding protein
MPKPLAEYKLEYGEPLTPDQLLEIPIFQETSRTLLEKHQGAVVRRRFKKGDIVCRQGEYGSTAFYILSGRCDIFISSPMAHVKSRKEEGLRTGFLGLVRKFTSGLVSREDHHQEGASQQRYVRVDAPVDLAYNNPVAQLGPGDLFGEMTCLSSYPRSATVRAAEDCEMLEMLRNILDFLYKSKTFKARLDEAYRQRAMDNHLRSVPIFAHLTDEFLNHLRQRVELERLAPGTIICREGEPADSFYLVRLGFIKVSQQRPGGELVLAYLGKGQYFGEMGLLAGGVRTATCIALDHAEVVKIAQDDFNLMLERFPDIKTQLQAEATRRQQASQAMARAAPGVPLDEFLEQGLMEAQNMLLIDLERCTRCDDCVRACADAHDGITRLVRDGLRYDKYLVATSCRSCLDPVCMIGCPVDAIHRNSESLEIIIEDWCIGCERCAKQCPYGNINMHEFEVLEEDPEAPGRKKAVVEKKATTCDLCAGLSEPSCVYACPHQAAFRIGPREFFAQQLVSIRR